MKESESNANLAKMVRKKKIIILAFTAAGHLNTILKVANELVLQCGLDKIEIIIYGTSEYKHLIDKIGAKYKSYKNIMLDSFKPPPLNNRRRLGFVFSIDQLFKITSDILLTLQYEIENEDPDLILYDHFSLFGTWVIRAMRQKYQVFLSNKNQDQNTTMMLKKFYRQLSLPKPPPISIMYTTSFAFADQVYPNAIEKKILNKQNFINKIKLIYYRIKVVIVQYLFCNKFGLKAYHLDPLKDFMTHKENLNIVFCSPELHPRSSSFDSSFKFVGCCVENNLSNNLHLNGGRYTNMEPSVKFILERFKPIDRENLINDAEKLIYFSLGTVFNDNFVIFKTIIEGIHLFLNSSKSANLSKVKVLISKGGGLKETSKQLENLIHILNFKQSEPIFYLCDSCPQLEILDRSSLFISHCGMNSINEAVWYGVPLICVPLSYDQPLIAYRAADELGLGITLNFIDLKVMHVKMAIEKIFSNRTYQKRCIDFAKMTRRHVGHINAANLIIECLKI